MSNLPSVCPKHPDAQILHEWDRTQFRTSLGAGAPIDGNHRYYCSVCKLEVCSPEEYEERIKVGK